MKSMNMIEGIQDSHKSHLIEYDDYGEALTPTKIKYDAILTASRTIAGSVIRTQCMKAHNLSERLGMDIYLKLESQQFTGSFSERGVVNLLLNATEEQKKIGFVTASTGNFGIAMSYYTTEFGIPCTVFMPRFSAKNKVNKCKQYGATVIQQGSNYDDAKKYALTMAIDTKKTFVHGSDNQLVIEGYGTVGLEILDDVSDADAILVPVGGGALLCGIGVVVKRHDVNTEIYGIETDTTNSLAESLRRNARAYCDTNTSIADGLAVNTIGANSYYNVKKVLNKMVVVNEDWVPRAIMHLIEDERLIVEGAAAVSIAALMSNLFLSLKGKKVVCVVSGSNIDSVVLGRAVERAMAAECRLVKFRVTTDADGGVLELCTDLGDMGVNIRDCAPEWAWVEGDVFSMQVTVTAETRSVEHTKELMEMIKARYPTHRFLELGECTEKPATRRGPCLARNPVCTANRN